MFMEIAFLLYVTLNAYVVVRAWQAMRGKPVLRIGVILGYLAWSSTFFLQHRLERGASRQLAEAFTVLGSLYTAVLIYLVLFTLLVDAIRLIDRIRPILPSSLRADRRKSGRRALVAVVTMTLLVVIAGLIHAGHFKVKTLDIVIDKAAGGRASLNLVLFADLHVGPFLGSSRLEKIVAAVNGLDPDIVVIPGDFYDEVARPEELERMVEILGRIRSRLGVYASAGNHEYFGGIARSTDLLARSGIRFLRDQTALVDESFAVVGRDSRSYLGADRRGSPFSVLLAGVDKSRPIIVLDHRPVRLDEAAEAGVDLVLCGHTHAGGVFPATLINGLLYKIGYGYGRIKNTQVYVTSGLGVWQPPIRVGTTAEIVRMKIAFRPRPVSAGVRRP